jgi:hypothetical protein
MKEIGKCKEKNDKIKHKRLDLRSKVRKKKRGINQNKTDQTKSIKT